MLTDITFLTPEEAADVIWAAKPQHMSRDEFVANWERLCPRRMGTGVYVSIQMSMWIDSEFCPSHVLLCQYPGDPTHATHDVQTAMRLVQRMIDAGTWRSAYGTADSEEQIRHYLSEFINDPDRQYVIEVHRLSKEHDGGFRFHKNGPYIGTLHELTEDGDPWLPEYLRDCSRLDSVLGFHIYEVRPVEGAEG